MKDHPYNNNIKQYETNIDNINTRTTNNNNNTINNNTDNIKTNNIINNTNSNSNTFNTNTKPTTDNTNTSTAEINNPYANMKTNLEIRYTFCIHISVRQAKPSKTMTREAVTEHILQSFIKAEAYTALATTTTTSSQRIITQSLYKPNSMDLIPMSKKFVNELQVSNKGIISGNIWISGDIPYASLKRLLLFKQHLSTKYSIHIMANKLNTRAPTEIGYFLHQLVQHDFYQEISNHFNKNKHHYGQGQHQN
jgi:hypothetical protein